MDLIDRLCNTKIENTSLFSVLDMINSQDYSISGNNLMLKKSVNSNKSKLIPLKCVREYYNDPLTNKKMPKVNLANPCNKIKLTFGISDCYNCRDCHFKLAEKCLSGEISLHKK